MELIDSDPTERTVWCDSDKDNFGKYHGLKKCGSVFLCDT